MNPMLNPSLTESEIQVSWDCIPRVQNQLDSETTGGTEKIPGFPKKTPALQMQESMGIVESC